MRKSAMAELSLQNDFFNTSVLKGGSESLRRNSVELCQGSFVEVVISLKCGWFSHLVKGNM